MSQHQKALVLSGGSIKGAYEAGAVKAILERGYKPEILLGISVGSLNTTFLANYVAQQPVLNWTEAGQAIWDFWSNNINQPKDLVKKKSNLMLLLYLNWGLLFKKFESILDTSPLKSLLHKTINPEVIKKTPVKLNIGTVNMYTGEIQYITPETENYLDYVMASTAIPVMMPAETIKGAPYLDGGLRDVAPLGRAITLGATELVGVCCQAETLDPVTFNPKDLIKLVSRIMDVMVNETINNDIKSIEKINQLLVAHPNPASNSPLAKYSHVNYQIIRPDNDINVDIESFTKADILKMLNDGYKQAQKVLGNTRWDV